jgi:plasmid rolling circle replication initiator protein Rep
MTKIQNNLRKSESDTNNFVDTFTRKKIPPLLDTLAQLSTRSPESDTKNVLKRRAVAKYITNEIIFPLIDENSILKKSYWRTYHCSSVLLQDGQKITGKYCNNRWCIVCNRIRTAKMINSYLPVIRSEILDPYFVTLTIPNVPGEELKSVITGMTGTIRKINNSTFRRKNFRLKGIRKLECTYNSTSNDYHPHFHFILAGEKAGQELINAWLNHYPEATRIAQNIKKADEGSLVELFKYSTKVVTGKNFIKQGNQIELKVHPAALDAIFRAFYGKRVFQSIGIKKLVLSEEIDEIQAQEIEGLINACEVYSWEQDASDWVSSTGELLTGCTANETYRISPI